MRTKTLNFHCTDETAYASPRVERINVKVEQGFAQTSSSDNLGGDLDPEEIDGGVF